MLQVKEVTGDQTDANNGSIATRIVRHQRVRTIRHGGSRQRTPCTV
jgi:hypothetical protein